MLRRRSRAIVLFKLFFCLFLDRVFSRVAPYPYVMLLAHVNSTRACVGAVLFCICMVSFQRGLSSKQMFRAKVRFIGVSFKNFYLYSSFAP